MSARRKNPRKERLRTGVRILSTQGFPPLPANGMVATLAPMRLLLLLTLLAGGWAVLAPEAQAANSPDVRVVELARVENGTFIANGRTQRFSLAGVHWRGTGRVVFRTRSLSERWSPWRAGAPEDEDGPDRRSSEVRRAGWTVGNPWWTGPSDRIEVRAFGRVSRVRAYLVWSPEVGVPHRVPATADAPPIVPRLSWGADESIRRDPPSYAPEVRFALVHHTAGGNDYTRAQAAAVVKGIQLYHVQGNGWNDIGYNYLVDRFGTVYEGRFGGIDRNVVGAHAQGFNTGSVGVALLGTYGNTAPSRAAQDAIARLLAWRLDLAHVDPTGLLTFISGGSERWPSGVPVLLGAVSGHRDTGFTECPGDALYSRLGALSSAARGVGLPKIFEPLVEADNTAVRFRARLSSAQSWEVVVTDSAGVEVARGSGTGSSVDWTWDSSAVAVGSYSWAVSAGEARPAVGVVRAGGGAQALAIEGVSADPEAISPNGDAQADTSLLGYRLTAPANVTVEVVDSIGGVVATVVDRVWTSAGQHETVLDGADLPDGRYGVVVTARTAIGVSAQKIVPLTVNRTLGLVTVAPAVFSPNGDGRRDRLTVKFSLAATADVRIRIQRDGRWVASPLSVNLLPGAQRFVWSGARSTGSLRDGSYEAVVEAQDEVGTISYGVPFASDTVAPRVRILPGRPLRVAVSEPAVLTLLIDGKALRREVRRAGMVRIPLAGPAARVRVVAWDAAANPSAPVLRVTRPGASESGE